MHIWNSSPGGWQDKWKWSNVSLRWAYSGRRKGTSWCTKINRIQEAVRQHRTAPQLPQLPLSRPHSCSKKMTHTVLRLWMKGPAYTTAWPWVRTVIEPVYLQNQPRTYLFIWRVQKNVLTQEHEKCIKWESCGFTMSLEKATNITFYISCNI